MGFENEGVRGGTADFHSLQQTVDDFVDVKASGFNRVQHATGVVAQQVQLEPVRNNRIQQVSITYRDLVRDQGAEVQILSPRFFLSKRYSPFRMSPLASSR